SSTVSLSAAASKRSNGSGSPSASRRRPPRSTRPACGWRASTCPPTTDGFAVTGPAGSAPLRPEGRTDLRRRGTGTARRAPRRAVRERGEPGRAGDDDEAEPRRDRNDHRQEPADHPQELKACLEPSERPAEVRVRRVALHDRVERQPPAAGPDG